MGLIETQDLDLRLPEPTPSIGAASTTNTSVVEEVQQNPIGFIWNKENETSNGS